MLPVPGNRFGIGVILGTAAYMAPEQARGAVVDKRADIWAYGVVLYEMLAGKQPFAGETVSDTLAAVLRAEAQWNAIPVSMAWLVRRCLEKNPKLRLRDIGDARIILEQPVSDSPGLPISVSGSPPRRPVAWMAATTLFALALAALWFLKPKPDQPLIQMEVSVPEGTTFRRVQMDNPIALSPDGRRLILAATGKDGKGMLWLRRLDATSATPIPGTENAADSTFWSPDSRWIGFFTSGKLAKIDVGGGRPQVICDAEPGGGTWNSEGVILFSQAGKPLQRVSASGGLATPVSSWIRAAMSFPKFSPTSCPMAGNSYTQASGRRSASRWAPLMARRAASCFQTETHPLLTRQTQPVPDGSCIAPVAGFSPGRLTRAGARPSERTYLSQTPSPLVQHGRPQPLDSWLFVEPATINPSSPGSAGTASRRAPPEIAVFSGARESPRIKRLSFSSARMSGIGISGSWMWPPMSRAVSLSSPGSDYSPMWSPDGSRVIYRSARQAELLLVERPKNRIGPETILPLAGGSPTGLSPDGRWLIAAQIGGIGLVSRADGKSVALFPGAASGSISPDGHWMLYSSTSAGRSEIVVQSLPQEAGGSSDAAGKWQISTAGGSHPVWRGDGKEIFYIASDGKMMAVPVESGVNFFRHGTPLPLFQTSLPAAGNYTRDYDVSRDGQRFLINRVVVDTGDPPITVILNWPKLLSN